MAMNCPACTSRMQKTQISGVAVEACPSCYGIWFDADVFLPAARAMAEKTEASSDMNFLFKPRHVDASTPDAPKLCPRCTVSLRNFNYAYDSNVFLDKCPQCGGVWTDPGEIRRVAAHIKGDPRVQEIGRDLLKRQKYMERIAEKPPPLSPLMFYMPHLLPLGDDLEHRRFPALTLALVVVCAVVFILTVREADSAHTTAVLWGHTPAGFSTVTLVTHMFLHADVFHLLANMYFLWLFGRSVEDRLGRKCFVPFYIAAGLAGGILQTMADIDSAVPMVGASGAISGVMGMYVMFFPMANIKLFCWGHIVRVTAAFYLGLWFVLQLAHGFLFGAGGFSNVAWFAHIGGFGFGAAAAFVIKTRSPRRDV